MANKIVEAYDEGKREEVMTMEMPIRSAISSLNALYEHRLHQRRFYKDLSPIFGDDYVFTMKDLRTSRWDRYLGTTAAMTQDLSPRLILMTTKMLKSMVLSHRLCQCLITSIFYDSSIV